MGIIHLSIFSSELICQADIVLAIHIDDGYLCVFYYNFAMSLLFVQRYTFLSGKRFLPVSYHKDIDALKVENEITPFRISDEKERIENLLAANGNKPLTSQRESISMLGWTDDAERTISEINEQDKLDAFGLTE
jgi:hypothetical protein